MSYLRKCKPFAAFLTLFLTLFINVINVHAAGVNVTVGESLNYPNGFNYMTHYFYMDGQLAYCLQPRFGPMSEGTYETVEIESDGPDGYPLLIKILACGYGGPNDLTGVYFPGASDRERYVYTHIAAGYAYMSNSQMGSQIYDITGLTNEQFESSGLGNFVRAAGSTPYKGKVRVVRVDGYQDIGYLASYYIPGREFKLTKKGENNELLEGAVYGVFSDRECNNLILTLPATGSDGETVGEISESYGEVFVKEITAPSGYVLANNVYEVDMNDSPYLEVKDRRISAPIEITKTKLADKNVKIEGAGFQIYSKNGLRKKANGEYDFDSATPLALNDKGDITLYTDANGYAKSKNLPYGSYVLTEKVTPKNYLKCKDVEFTISKDFTEIGTVKLDITDDSYKIKFRINKVCETFLSKIKSPDGQRAVFRLEEASSGRVIFDNLEVNDEGYITLPSLIESGTYKIVETKAPYGYELNPSPVTITFDDSTNVTIDQATGDKILEVEIKNKPIEGKVYISKSGELIKSVTPGNEKNNQNAKFTYENAPLSGTEFSIYALNDVFSPDGSVDSEGNRVVIYKKDDLIGKVKTDDKGSATYSDSSKPLYFGEYYVTEDMAPTGFVKDDTKYEFKIDDSLKDAGFTADISIENKRQKSVISIKKTDSTKKLPLKDAEFSIYASEDIKKGDMILIKKGDFVGKCVTDDKGVATFDNDLCEGKYLIKETKAPKGYVLGKDSKEVTVKYGGNEEIIKYEISFTNEEEKKPEEKEVKKPEKQEEVKNEDNSGSSQGTVVKGVTKTNVSKNNYRTDDNGEDGYSILLDSEPSEVTEGKAFPTKALYAGLLVGCLLAIVISSFVRKKIGEKH